MPGGDRTGPTGVGPRTGRGMGYCSSNDQPGYAGAAPGFRCGFGFRRAGMGRGWKHRFYATGVPGWAALTAEQETTELKAQAESLKEQLAVIQKRIEQLESK
jgi:hypothetical protein